MKKYFLFNFFGTLLFLFSCFPSPTPVDNTLLAYSKQNVELSLFYFPQYKEPFTKYETTNFIADCSVYIRAKKLKKTTFCYASM